MKLPIQSKPILEYNQKHLAKENNRVVKAHREDTAAMTHVPSEIQLLEFIDNYSSKAIAKNRKENITQKNLKATNNLLTKDSRTMNRPDVDYDCDYDTSMEGGLQVWFDPAKSTNNEQVSIIAF